MQACLWRRLRHVVWIAETTGKKGMGMHQLGLSAADIAVLVHKEQERGLETLEKFAQANVHAGMPPEDARRFALVQYMHEYTTTLLEANNRKIAADLIRLGVLTGTITNGEPAF